MLEVFVPIYPPCELPQCGRTQFSNDKNRASVQCELNQLVHYINICAHLSVLS